MSTEKQAELTEQLSSAIRDKRKVTFVLDERPRVAEPHDLGVIDGELRLFFYQTGGESKSGKGEGWRIARLHKVSELVVTAQSFNGARPAPSGRHIAWDDVIASVSAREETAPKPAAPRPRKHPTTRR